MTNKEGNFSGHTVKSYDKDLQSISQTLETMLELVIQSIDMVALMIKTRDEKLIETITAHDYKINSLDHLIEKKSYGNFGIKTAHGIRFALYNFLAQSLFKSGAKW